jgi:hypothetical protein
MAVNGKLHSATPLTLGLNTLGPFGYGVGLVISTVDYIATKKLQTHYEVPPLAMSTESVRSFHCVTFLSKCVNNTMLSENKIIQQTQKATKFSTWCIKKYLKKGFCVLCTEYKSVPCVTQFAFIWSLALNITILENLLSRNRIMGSFT